MDKKKIILASVSSIAIVGLLGTVGLFTVNKAFADDSNSTYSTIVKNIAAKFGLAEADVQTVFEETRTQERSDRLQEAVDAGEITSEQKALILAKQDEMKSKMDELRNQSMTEDERRTAMEALRTEQESWAEANGIDMKYLMVRGGIGGRGDMGGRGSFGGREFDM